MLSDSGKITKAVLHSIRKLQLLVVLTLVASLTCTCTQGIEKDTIHLAPPAQDTGLSTERLEPPSQMKLPSLLEGDIFRLGKDYEETLPHYNVEPVFNAARFTPQGGSLPGSFQDLAFAIYSFNLIGYAGEEAIHFHWNETANYSNAWVGLADFARDRWQWFPMPELGVLDVEFENYTSPTGNMLVVPLFTGLDPWELAWLRCGQPSSTWFHSWGLAQDDGVKDITVDGSGNVYLCGSTTSSPSQATLALLVKYHSGGELAWVRTWGRGYLDEAFGVCTDSEGNVFATGVTKGFDGSVKIDCFILKFSRGGNLLWERRWSSERYDWGNSIIADENGDIFVGGRVDFNDALVLKYSGDGDLIWQKSWGGIQMDIFYGLFLDQEGSLLVTGSARSVGANLNEEVILLKLDTAGELVFQKAWGNLDNDNAYTVVVNGNGDICLTGVILQPPSSLHDVLVIKCDSLGELKWAATWGTNGIQSAAGCELDSHGNAYTVFWSSTTSGVEYVMSGIAGPGLTQYEYVYKPVVNDPVGLYYGLGISIFPDDSFAIGGDMVNAQNGFWEWRESEYGLIEIDEHLSEIPLLEAQGSQVSCEGNLAAPTGTLDVGGGHQDVTVQRIDNPWL